MTNMRIGLVCLGKDEKRFANWRGVARIFAGNRAVADLSVNVLPGPIHIQQPCNRPALRERVTEEVHKQRYDGQRETYHTIDASQ